MSLVDQMKKNAALAALKYIPDDKIIGVGTGSTVNFFIDALAKIKHRIEGTVASSISTEQRLKEHKIPVFDLNSTGELAVYIDGTDAFNNIKQLVKGGGGALTREKIVANASSEFICIVDESKQSNMLSSFPIPIEVIPMARSYVGREVLKLGGQPIYRENYITDNGNVILDVHNWEIDQPIEFEERINQIVGVVCHGLFAKRGADRVLVGQIDDVIEI